METLVIATFTLALVAPAVRLASGLAASPPWRAAVALACLGANGLLEKRESLYNNIFVFGDDDTVTMTFGQNRRYYTESSMKLSDPAALTVEYTRYMTLGIAYPPKVERILEIGLGGAARVSYLHAHAARHRACSRSNSTRTWSNSRRSISSSRGPRACAPWSPTAAPS